MFGRNILLILLSILLLIAIAMVQMSTVFETHAQQAVVMTIIPDPTAIKSITGDAQNRWSTMVLSYTTVVVNLWGGGITQATGSMYINSTPKGLIGFGNFTGPWTSISTLGSPGVRYGSPLWGGESAKHPEFNIPLRIRTIPTMLFLANYSIDMKITKTPIMFKFHIWAVKATRTSGPTQGDLYIGVEFYRSPEWLPTTPPATNITLPVVVNGTLKYIKFNVWLDNPTRTQAAQTSVNMIPANVSDMITKGLVMFSLNDVLANVYNILSGYGWKYDEFTALFIQMIDVFFDFASSPAGKAVFKWYLYDLKFIKILPTGTISPVTITTTVTTTTTAVSTTTLPKTITTTSIVPTTVTSVVISPTTVVSTSTSTVTTRVTATVTQTISTTVVSTSTTTVTVTEWTTTAVLGIVLLIIGIAIGWFIKRK